MIDLSGKTVIVTGASRGIGEETARHMTTLGATVILAARSTAKIDAIASDLRVEGAEAHAISCDMGDCTNVQTLIQETVERTGRIDVLVNNAAVIDPISRLADADPAAWSSAVDINLKGVFYGLRFALPHMIGQGGGTIINISSGAATSALEGWSHYCSTKAAVLSLTRCVDKEYRAHGIRVIGLSPGTVATEMQVQIRASGINPVSQLDPSVHIPSEWVARAIAYLCTPAADQHRGCDFSLKSDSGRAEVGLT